MFPEHLSGYFQNGCPNASGICTKALFVVYSTYVQLFNKVKNKKGIFKESKELIISTIDHVKTVIGKKRALRAFGISYQQY